MILFGLLVSAIAFAILLNRLAGRLAALGAAVLCGMAIAYFLMPPVFSFRISETKDCIALGFYGVISLIVARPTRSRERKAGVPAESKPKRPFSELAVALANLKLTEHGLRLAELDLVAPVESFFMPCSQNDLQSVLRDVLKEATLNPLAKRLSICASQRPGMRRLLITAHLVWPAPQDQNLIIGKRDGDCELMECPDWPANVRVSYFETGSDLIFQLSVFAE